MQLTYYDLLKSTFQVGLDGAVVSALDFRTEGRWFEAGPCYAVVSLDSKRSCTLGLRRHTAG